MSDKVVIFDTTLRDGEQSPGISLDPAEKLEIAEQLARLGVDYIEAGFPVASQGDFEAVQAIARTVHGPVIAALSRTQLADVDRCYEALRDAVDDVRDKFGRASVGTASELRESGVEVETQRGRHAFGPEVTP